MPRIAPWIVLLRAEGLNTVRCVSLRTMQHAFVQQRQPVGILGADGTAPPRTGQRLVLGIGLILQGRLLCASGVQVKG